MLLGLLRRRVGWVRVWSLTLMDDADLACGNATSKGRGGVCFWIPHHGIARRKRIMDPCRSRNGGSQHFSAFAVAHSCEVYLKDYHS
jgi:hypothetical protein